jgi:hypothetical protein
MARKDLIKIKAVIWSVTFIPPLIELLVKRINLSQMEGFLFWNSWDLINGASSSGDGSLGGKIRLVIIIGFSKPND